MLGLRLGHLNRDYMNPATGYYYNLPMFCETAKPTALLKLSHTFFNGVPISQRAKNDCIQSMNPVGVMLALSKDECFCHWRSQIACQLPTTGTSGPILVNFCTIGH